MNRKISKRKSFGMALEPKMSIHPKCKQQHSLVIDDGMPLMMLGLKNETGDTKSIIIPN